MDQIIPKYLAASQNKACENFWVQKKSSTD